MATRLERLDALAPDQSLSDRTAEVLRGLIADGRYQPGERMNEVEISGALGVSRGPVREALQRLAVEGFVNLVPRKGAFVADFDPDTIGLLFEVREVLESRAAGLAAERARDHQIKDLRELLDQTERRLGKNGRAQYPTDMDFHRRVVQLSSNPYLLSQCDAVQTQVRLARSRSGHVPQRAMDALREHRLILEAIAAHDITRAEEEMRSHLRSSLTSIEALSDGGWNGGVADQA